MIKKNAKPTASLTTSPGLGLPSTNHYVATTSL
jgi:hypothetical protein